MRPGSCTYISLGLEPSSAAPWWPPAPGLIPGLPGRSATGRLRLAESVAASATALMAGEDTRRVESVLRFRCRNAIRTCSRWPAARRRQPVAHGGRPCATGW